jgi:hypothetical protein
MSTTDPTPQNTSARKTSAFAADRGVGVPPRTTRSPTMPRRSPHGVHLVMSTGISRLFPFTPSVFADRVQGSSTSRPGSYSLPSLAGLPGARRSPAEVSTGVPPSSGSVSVSTSSRMPGSRSRGSGSRSITTCICRTSGGTSPDSWTVSAGVALGGEPSTPPRSSFTTPAAYTCTSSSPMKAFPFVESANSPAAQGSARTCRTSPSSERRTSGSRATRRRAPLGRPERSARGVCGARCQSHTHTAGHRSVDGVIR